MHTNKYVSIWCLSSSFFFFHFFFLLELSSSSSVQLDDRHWKVVRRLLLPFLSDRHRHRDLSLAPSSSPDIGPFPSNLLPSMEPNGSHAKRGVPRTNNSNGEKSEPSEIKGSQILISASENPGSGNQSSAARKEPSPAVAPSRSSNRRPVPEGGWPGEEN